VLPAVPVVPPRGALPPVLPAVPVLPPPPPLEPPRPPVPVPLLPPVPVHVSVKTVQLAAVFGSLQAPMEAQRFVVRSSCSRHPPGVFRPSQSMVPQALSSSGIRLQRPTPLQALHGELAVPQLVPADGYRQCAWPSHMPPHLRIGSLALFAQLALSVPAGSGMQVPVESQVPQ
jgi:hypothetical protein